MAVTTTSTRLGCGRDIDEVWASIDRPPNAHEQTCPDCQHARANLSKLAAITVEQRHADTEDPELQPDPDILNRIMTIARVEVRRGRRLPLDEPDPSQLVPNLTVSEQAVAAVVRHAGDSTPGVQVRRVRVNLHTNTAASHADAEETSSGAPSVDKTDNRRPGSPPPGTGADAMDQEPTLADPTNVPEAAAALEARPARVAVLLRISVTATAVIPTLSQDLRHTVMEAVKNEIGMDLVKVDVLVEDVHDD